nr:reverse transcriptase domain-containing protein [Tanacetum cinerariifolium]
MIDRLARSLLIQGLPNDIYSLPTATKLLKTYEMLLQGICLVLNMVNRIRELQFCMSKTFMKRRPEECYDLIKNMIAHHNDWDTYVQRITVGQTQNIYAAGAYNQGGNSYQPQGNRNFFSYRSNNYLGPPGFNQNQSNPNQNYQNRNQGNNHGNVQGNNQGRNQFFQIASHGQNPPPAYQAPAYQALGYQAPVHGTLNQGDKDTVPPTNNESTKDVQPPVVQVETQIPNSKPIVAPVVEPFKALVSALKPNLKPSIPYPSILHYQKLRDKANDQKEKKIQIFQDLNFNISLTDALILMPKFGSTIKSLLTNKEKLFELHRTLLNKHYSAVLHKKLPEKLGDLEKFLIPCDFSRMDECLALTDLSASINLMPLSMWNKLSLPELSPMFVDFDADPRVPLILGRSFLKTGRALIDVYEGELTLRVGNKAITFNLDQTLRYSANYDAELINRIDVTDVACEE